MPSIMRRFSRNSSNNHPNSMPNSPPGSFSQPRAMSNGPPPRGSGGAGGGPPMPGSQHQPHDDLRPSSMGTDHSFEFAPPRASLGGGGHGVASPGGGGLGMAMGMASPGGLPTMPAAGLSRTDQIVLRHFWEEKVQLNRSRDLHFLKVPTFSEQPSHNELVPFCEIYHLVRSTPRAAIIGLGSANGVYIGFELFTGSELQLNIHDEWRNVSHYRVVFRSYESLMKDPNSEAIFKSWPKPLTIEFLDEEYQKWSLDLTSLCWDGREVREFGGSGSGGSKQGDASVLL